MACLIAPPVGPSGERTACSFPSQRSRTGSRPGGKRAARRIDPDHLDWALSDFASYITADELYDGPFCVLSIVDNRTFKRLLDQVLDHDPTHVDIKAFFRRFQAAPAARGLTLKGITTDGSPLYPELIAKVFGEVPHQLCTFYILKEVTKAILGAVAKLRKNLASEAPKLARGRPGSRSGSRGRSVSCSSTAASSCDTISRPPNGRSWLGSPEASHNTAPCAA